jgi:dihydroflavonol-4-reductase
MKKVLITGANGFLGSNLTRELYRLGYEVRILVRAGADLKGVADIPCEIFFGNIDERADVDLAVRGCRLVVHAASITDQWAIPFTAYERVNYTGTCNIADACVAQQVERLIYVSTANTMGPGSKEKPGSELNGFTLFNANSGYINTKYMAQQYVLEQVERKQLSAIIVSPTFMIGPNDIKPSSGKLLLYGLHKRVLFYPPGGKNFVYINDVCQGIINALDNGKVGDCYLLAGDNLTYKEFFTLVNGIEKTAGIMIRIPVFVMKLAGAIGSFREKVMGKSSKLNYTAAYLLCLDNYYSGKKSERELLVNYTPVEDAVRKALCWFKDHNYY